MRPFLFRELSFGVAVVTSSAASLWLSSPRVQVPKCVPSKCCSACELLPATPVQRRQWLIHTCGQGQFIRDQFTLHGGATEQRRRSQLDGTEE